MNSISVEVFSKDERAVAGYGFLLAATAAGGLLLLLFGWWFQVLGLGMQWLNWFFAFFCLFEY